ncbi:MAG: hypothetical protein CVV51_11970 [Spirochaetae bacterium HGW-Spirochaetae-7]|nr:MAG: hypothetical protein CVV51_11970 [Spirochaetae bacterium HGW-Spirochaetae-7]
MSNEKMKQPKTAMEDGETLISSDAGRIIFPFLGAQAGRVFLTTKRVFHESLMEKITREVKLADIANATIESAGFTIAQLGIFGFFMKCTTIYQKNGNKMKFTSRNNQGWIIAIKEALKA